METKCDILIVGGGLGGVAAALAVARMGYSAILTEETDWIGGQLTSQLVPQDEHPWIEAFGCTQSYRELRMGIRDYYRRYYPLTAQSLNTPNFNPGAALVTRLACEPKVALAVLDQMIAPYLAARRLEVWLNHRPIAATTIGDQIRSVTLADVHSGDQRTVEAALVLDATELGDLLELVTVEHVLGAESVDETGELHAVKGPAQPLNMQAITHCFALSYHPEADYTIEKPRDYDFWAAYQAPFESDLHFSSAPRPTARFSLFPEAGTFSIWQFRRILYKDNFAPGFFPSDLTIINNMHNDYWLRPIIGVSEEESRTNVEAAKQLSLSFLYWLQTTAPRSDGKQGYPGLRLRPDVTGTVDGLAKYPYIRESRRIRALHTMSEQDVGIEARGDLGAPSPLRDTVGIGSYRIDLHPTTGGDASLNIPAYPFELPLASFIPVRLENLLPAAKNIGVTHIANGCTRLHQVEWNIGEVAGVLAAYCLKNRKTPRQVQADDELLTEFQGLLEHYGIPLHWPQVGEGTSYYKAHKDLPDWHWGETDKTKPDWLYAR